MKSIICLLASCLFFAVISAQKIHLNTFLGVANYYGDLQSKRFTFDQSKLAIGGGLSYEVSDKFFIRTGLSIAQVSADDKYNPQTRVRNLNFTTSIKEAFIAGEYYFRNLYESPVSPYIFAGVAMYHFNPYTYDTTGNKIYLQPFSTEGEGFYQNRQPYRLSQFAIPLGVGIKLALSENVRMGFEIGYRKLFTDYLDDVSSTYVDPNLLLANRGPKSVELAYRASELKNAPPYPIGDNRGGSKFKDWYYFSGVTTSFRIGNGDKGGRSHYKVGCPGRIY